VLWVVAGLASSASLANFAAEPAATDANTLSEVVVTAQRNGKSPITG
jgi:hypothetical protein